MAEALPSRLKWIPKVIRLIFQYLNSTACFPDDHLQPLSAGYWIWRKGEVSSNYEEGMKPEIK